MKEVKEDLLRILNQARELEHAARIQYSVRAQKIAATLEKIEKNYKSKRAKEIMEINLSDENEAIGFYKLIRSKVGEYRQEIQLELERLSGEIQTVINDEHEHLERLTLFVKKLEERVAEKIRYRYRSALENDYTIKQKEQMCSRN